MINAFHVENNLLVQGEFNLSDVQHQPLWFDLTNPTPEERQTIEHVLGCVIPDMRHIQKPQQRMSLEEGQFIMMSHMVASEGGIHLVRVLFVMTERYLVTLHLDPWEPNIPSAGLDSDHLPLSLLNQLLYQSVTHVGQALEFCQEQFDGISKNLFLFGPNHAPQKQENKHLLKFNTIVGQCANNIASLQDHLEGVERCIDFLNTKGFPTDKESLKRSFRQLGQEIQSTSGLACALTKSAGFLQEATVSHIAINQNDNIEFLTKIVAFLTPPLLVLGVVDLVFREQFSAENMMRYGTVFVLLLLSSIMTYYWFKKDD